MKKKMFFIVGTRMPTEKANGYQVAMMCTQYASLGYDVTLVVPRRKNPIKESVFDFYGLKETFLIKKIGLIDFIVFSKFIGSLAYWFHVVYFLFMLSFIKMEKGSVVYTRNPEVVWLGNKKGCTTVYECHDWFGKRKKLSLWFLKQANLIVTTNNIIRERFLEHGFDESKIIKAANAIDISTFDILTEKKEARKKLSLPEEGSVVVYTGHLYERKGVHVLAEAAKKLPPHTTVYFVGGTDKDVALFAEKYKNISSIKVVGHRPHAQMPLWQKAADVLVLPNIAGHATSKYYTSPLKLFEYMASKRPIIASNLPAVLEIVNSETALIVDPENSQELKETIVKVLEGGDETAFRAERAYSLVKKRTWENRAQMIHMKIKELDKK
ncbi:MAG: glycosyltransferase [Candidatus Pacebacteria bacterium]|nr:glycosyltransferase [Candidatus Paceibacterota bacterium]